VTISSIIISLLGLLDQAGQSLDSFKAELFTLLLEQKLLQPRHLATLLAAIHCSPAKDVAFEVVQHLISCEESEKPAPRLDAGRKAQSRSSCLPELLQLLSKAMPELFFEQLNTFLLLFDSDSYVIRNCICDIIQVVLSEVLTDARRERKESDDELEIERRMKLKQYLIVHIVKRVQDKNSLVRAHALTILFDLCRRNVVPSFLQKDLLKASIGRARDNHPLVRRHAFPLISEILKYY